MDNFINNYVENYIYEATNIPIESLVQQKKEPPKILNGYQEIGIIYGPIFNPIIPIYHKIKDGSHIYCFKGSICGKKEDRGVSYTIYNKIDISKKDNSEYRNNDKINAKGYENFTIHMN